MLRISEKQAYILVENYIKVYPNFIKVVQYENPIRVLQKNLEVVAPSRQHSEPRSATESDELTKALSLRRTKTTISDITLCNSFDSFVTFTFAKDRDNVDLLKNRMSKWLKNQREIYGPFKYIIVPEYHKDGKSIHFHALFKDYKGPLTKTKHRINGRSVFHLKSYKHGFTTLVKIDDISKVSSYIKKYITKDMPIFKGRKRYWCSTKLLRPFVTHDKDILNNPYLTFVNCYKKDNFIIYHCDVTLKTLNQLEGTKSWINTTLQSLESYVKYDWKQETLKLENHTQ